MEHKWKRADEIKYSFFSTLNIAKMIYRNNKLYLVVNVFLSKKNEAPKTLFFPSNCSQCDWYSLQKFATKLAKSNDIPAQGDRACDMARNLTILLKRINHQI